MCVAIRHVKRMRHITMPSMARLAPPHFSKLSHKRHDFRKKAVGRKMC